MNKARNNIHPSWFNEMGSEFDKPYMEDLRLFLRDQLASKKTVFPKSGEWFSAFNATPFDKVKAVIIGQDPYHGDGQAHGLCFSVRPGVAIPPSLKNIFQELNRDLGLPIAKQGNLDRWAEQGVLLLNATLTVERARAGSHQGKGWEQFTDCAIKRLNEEREGLVFLLWGSFAQKKGQYIDRDRHLVLTAPHPSPLSAYRGFIGCGHFSQTNQYLQSRGVAPIDWSLA